MNAIYTRQTQAGYRLAESDYFVADLEHVPQIPKEFFECRCDTGARLPTEAEIKPEKEAEADAIMQRAMAALREQRLAAKRASGYRGVGRCLLDEDETEEDGDA